MRCLVIYILTLAVLAWGKESSDKSRSQIVSFLSGGLAGTISSTVTMPLEVIKTQLQSSRVAGNSNPLRMCKKVFKAEGYRGFFKGIKPMLFGIIPTRAIYFWAYSTSKDNLTPAIGNTPLNHLVSAFVAGITSNTITNPIWMVKTRFQILADTSVGQRAFKSYGEVVQTIMREEGPPGFFKGMTASYIGCFEGAIQWIVYEKAKTLLSTTRQVQAVKEGTEVKAPSAVDFFLMASFSKLVAICATYPHEVIRTRLREQATNGAFKYNGFFSALKVIAKEEGRRGLYGGMGMHLARSVPNAAIMFLSFELVSSWLEKNQDLIEQSFNSVKNGKISKIHFPNFKLQTSKI